MTAIGALGREAFASLTVPNYRRFMIGQTISMVGTWMQIIAQGWLVLQVTSSATSLGIVISLQTAPLLLLGPYGGLVADRMDKRRLLMVVAALMGAQATALGLLSVAGQVQIWQVYTLAVVLGLCSCFEQPARQAFVQELVGAEHLRNAVGLNSTSMSAARAIGPAIAGVVIAASGVGVCFLLNGATFLAVIVTLALLDRRAIEVVEPVARETGQLRAGLSYAIHSPAIAVPLVMTALVGCLTFEFAVTLPVLAESTFDGDARVFGLMASVMGAGAVVGGLVIAARGRTGIRPLVATVTLFGVAMLGLAVAPSVPLALVALFVAGAVSVAFLSISSTTAQLAAPPQVRGRVMGLWTVAFLGTTPVGAPIAGWVTEAWGARAGIAMGGIACLVAAVFGELLGRRAKASAAAEAELAEVSVEASATVAAEAEVH